MSKIAHIRQSLSIQLSLAILLLAVFIFVVSVGSLFYYSRKIVRQEAIERATRVLGTTSLRVGRFLNEIETVTNNTEWLVQQYFLPDSLLAFTHRIVELNPDVNGCSITTEPYMFKQYGRYFSAYSVREGDTVTTVREGEYEYFDKVWYKTPRALGKACWVDPFDDYNAGTLSSAEMIASYCKPLHNDEGQFIGVISTDLSLKRLSQAITAERPYPNSYFIMLGEEGHFFVHPDTSRLVNQTIFTGIDPHAHPDIIALGHEMMVGYQGSMKVNVDGYPCLVCYQPIPNTAWSVALISPESDIFSNYRRLGYIIMPLIFVGLLFVTFLTRRAVIHGIAPLHQLVGMTRLIADGHYDHPIPQSRRIDAVGKLQNSFSVMQQSLAKQISHVKQINDETTRRNEEVEKANLLVQESLRQKTAFIQNMTHQIHTPLNIIMGFSQVLRDDIHELSNEEIKSILTLIERNTLTVSRMTAMLYDCSDSGTAIFSLDEDVPVNEVARQSIDIVCHQYPSVKEIAFHTTIPDTFTLHSNRLYLYRIIRELLFNSAKYSDGQHIALHVSAAAVPGASAPGVSAGAADNTLRLVFEDTGPGIPEKNYTYLLSPFNKTDDLSEGLGLGLPLTKRHVHNMGGNFDIDTSYRTGCRIIVTLPCIQS